MREILTEKLREKDFNQLIECEQAYLADIGEEPMDADAQERLRKAIEDRKIQFFAAKVNEKLIGMCSVVTAFSTFACTDSAVLEDLYIAPAYRKQGAARFLVNAAADYCREVGASGLTVCCAPCDEAMYNSLGFEVKLGTEFVMPLD